MHPTVLQLPYAALRGLQHTLRKRLPSRAHKTNRRDSSNVAELLCGLLLLPLLAAVPAQAQVFTGNLTLRTQAEVDAFTYPEVTGTLWISGGDEITSLAALHTLTTVGKDVFIRDNDALTNLDGLNNITTVGDDLTIAINPALTSLDGLSNLTAVKEFLSIEHNDALHSCNCGVGGLLASGGVMGAIAVGDNLPGCNSTHEILAGTCDTATAVAPLADQPRHVTLDDYYPNPFNSQTTLRLTLPVPQHVHLAVYDLMGREVAVLLDDDLPDGRHEVIFEADGLPSGLYVARLRTDEKTIRMQQMLLVK